MTNVTLADVAVTGDYDDLTNKPTIPAPEIFWATYGTTTAAEIDAAVAAGKAVMIYRNNANYVLTNVSANEIYFGCSYASNNKWIRLTINSNAWSEGLTSLQATGSKVLNITSSSSDAQYPSAASVYRAIHPAIATTQPAGGFLPNIVYDLGTLSGNTTFALATPADANVVNHYYWTFDTGSTAPTITWPTGLTWFGGSAPTINASKHYEISVLNGIGVAMEV